MSSKMLNWKMVLVCVRNFPLISQAISAHFPEEHLPNYAKSRFPLILCFSAQNLKRARTMPRAPKSDQMEDPGMGTVQHIALHYIALYCILGPPVGRFE